MTLWINHHHSGVLDGLLMPVSWLGEGGGVWILIMLLLLIFGGRRERLVALICAAGLIVTELLLMPLCREWWPRPRPYTYLPDVRQLGIAWQTTSFPSGHVYLWMAATILYGNCYRKWLWPLIVLTVLTAYSRPYAGMHHVLDVLGGAVVGGVVGVLELLVARRLGLTSANASNAVSARSDRAATGHSGNSGT